MAKTIGQNIDAVIKLIEDSNCYEIKLLELLKGIRAEHTDPQSGKWNLTKPEDYFDLINDFVTKAKQTAKDCAGRDISVKFGDSIGERILQIVLNLIGIDLD